LEASRAFLFDAEMRFEEGKRAGEEKKKEDRLAHGFLIVVFPWDEGQMPRRGLEVSLLLREIP